MSEVTEAFQRDLDRHRGHIQQNEEQLTLLTDGVNATNINLGKLIKDQKFLEVDILKYKEKMDQEKEEMVKRLSDMETSLKAFNEKDKKRVPDPPKTDRDIKNIIFEGLNEIRDENVYETVIGTIRELDINIYDNDLNLAHRIGTFKGENAWPRPIRVEFVSTHVRNVIWQNRRKMENSPSHFNVRISRDEAREVRQARAILRKLAAKARNQGKSVYQHEDHILIDGRKYDLQNAAQTEGTPSYAQVTGGWKPTPPSRDISKAEQKADPKTFKLPAERKTEAGLAFFTKDSKKSCFHPTKVVYEGVEYQTPEHNYQCIKALTSEMMDLYHKIKEAPTARRAKQLGGEVPYNPEWEKIKPDVMFKIQLKKHEQHTELGEELCANEGIFMEASRDSFWGTGVTIMDPALDSGKFPGRNELGLSLGRVKEVLLSRRTVPMSEYTTPHIEQSAPHRLAAHPTMTNPDPGSEVNSAKATTARANQFHVGAPNQLEKDKEVPKPRKREEHSLEIEVLETNIPVCTKKAREGRVWEPTVFFKEGTIVV